ncbi:MAG TPA: hypothetical protein VGL05_19545 [Kribbella sp.]
MSKYTAQVERDGKFWLIRVPEVDRATQARHVREIESMARDLISVMEDVPADSFELDVRIELPKSAQDHLGAAEAYREQAADANRRAAQEARMAAKELAGTMPLRDVAAVLHVSHQRVHQLVNS